MATTATKASHRGGLVRTNVVLDEALVRKAMELTGVNTKRQVIDEALKMLIRIREQEGAIERLWGAFEWQGDLAEMRKGRIFDGSR